METTQNLVFYVIITVNLSLYGGNYLNGNNNILDEEAIFYSLPLWGKLLEWKHRYILGIVVYTERADKIRIISARKASKQERKLYE